LLGELLEGKPHEQFLWGGVGNGRGSSAPRQSLTRQTDIRTLKIELHLEQLTSATPDMVAKEIDMAVAAYNLVRAMICLAAEQSGVRPRGYSFTKVRRIMQTFGPALANAATPEEAQRIFDQMMHYVQQSKLPRRKRLRPSYPRKVWSRGANFPKRKN
jgi:hypothetical protein